jgi:hypothetical protein
MLLVVDGGLGSRVEVMSFSDFIDSMEDSDRRDLVEEYARNGIGLSDPLGERPKTQPAVVG